MGASILQLRQRRPRARMTVANFHRRFDLDAVAGFADPGRSRPAGITDPDYRVPVHVIDFEFIANQIVRVSDRKSVV